MYEIIAMTYIYIYILLEEVKTHNILLLFRIIIIFF